MICIKLIPRCLAKKILTFDILFWCFYVPIFLLLFLVFCSESPFLLLLFLSSLLFIQLYNTYPWTRLRGLVSSGPGQIGLLYNTYPWTRLRGLVSSGPGQIGLLYNTYPWSRLRGLVSSGPGQIGLLYWANFLVYSINKTAGLEYKHLLLI